jgi:internalin A
MPAPLFESEKAEAAYRTAQERIAKAAREKATKLDLNRLGLTSVPPEIGQLVSLTTLELFDNQLTSLPPEIGQLKNLTELFLRSNQQISLPPEIGQLANLTRLSVSKNHLTTLPPEIGQLASLSTLQLYDNQLRTLPEDLRRISSLKALFLHENPQLDLPASVLGVEYRDWNGHDSTAPRPGPILDYYFATIRADDRQPLNEAKLILVGRGEAGKTSLVKRLVENKFSRR